MNNIWQSIRLHHRCQPTGVHFIDFHNIHLELFERLSSFIEDNIFRSGTNIAHHGEVPEAGEELYPTVENLTVIT